LIRTKQGRVDTTVIGAGVGLAEGETQLEEKKKTFLSWLPDQKNGSNHLSKLLLAVVNVDNGQILVEFVENFVGCGKKIKKKVLFNIPPQKKISKVSLKPLSISSWKT